MAIGTVIKVIFTRLLPLAILALAIFVGWLNTFPIPEGTFFTMLYPVLKGYLPPVISGGYKESPVIPLPHDDVSLEPRPVQETFVKLPGSPEPKNLCSFSDGDDHTQAEELACLDAIWEAEKPYQMPQQGLGMCCRYTAYDPESVRRTILWYLKVGGRHIDTADLYQNHEWIGEAIQTAMKEYKINREEIWVTTKLWPRFYGDNSTQEAIPRMLKELQLDYIDLVLMHVPSNSFGVLGAKTECDKKEHSPKECRQETWQALSKVRESGAVKHIGVSNFNVRQLKEIIELDNVAPIANHQFLYNPWVPEYLHEAFDFCQENDISVTAWSSFAGTAMQHFEAFSVETLQRIAEAHETTVPQILLKWALQKGAIVIPGTGNPKHMKENLKAFTLQLTEKEMAEISDLRKDESAKKFFVQPVDES